jgi:hypothetical protein
MLAPRSDFYKNSLDTLNEKMTIITDQYKYQPPTKWYFSRSLTE